MFNDKISTLESRINPFGKKENISKGIFCLVFRKVFFSRKLFCIPESLTSLVPDVNICRFEMYTFYFPFFMTGQRDLK